MINNIHQMPKVSMITPPPSWKSGANVVTRDKGMTLAELIQKIVMLAASGEINLNAEVMVYNQDGDCVGVDKIQRGPGNIVVLR